MAGIELIAGAVIAKEFAESLRIVADGIQNFRTVREAIRDGKYYIKQMPEIKPDLLIMLKEMKKSLKGLAKASSIITDFRFTVTGSAMDIEPARFNKYVIGRCAREEELWENLDELQGSCEVIRKHADKLGEMAAKKFPGQRTMMKLLHIDPGKRELEAEVALRNIHYHEMNYHNVVRVALNLVNIAIKDVQSQLGQLGMAEPKNVPKAAQLLGLYADSFTEVENRAKEELHFVKKINKGP